MMLQNSDWLWVTLKANTLARLMKNGALCVADFRCLDCESKDSVRKLCLKNCANCLFSCQACNNHR